ncbi:hypothetical protein BGZ72_004409 [Mortierella alpina]|nr:hypothetical protein BGZ72_004409 [Mortierella alpina]
MPLVYHSITRTNWHHRSFPIQQRGNVYAHHRQKSGVFHIPALEQYRPQLRVVRDIEWICNVYLQERDRKLVPQSFKPRKQLSTFRLRSILQWLEELKLSGPWFRIDVDKHKRALQPSAEPWKIRKLTITENFLPLLRYCPNLKELERILRYGYDWRSTRTINSIIWIKACPMLERLKLCKWIPEEFQSADMVETLCTLRYLKTLIYQAHRVEDVAFLCSAADTPAETRVLPFLEHLDIDINPYARFQTKVMIQECYATILRDRPELKSFISMANTLESNS